ncbi:MAG TPA: hypothetical protein VFN11_06005 [Ktedonobacterales bacterium]|nr:hypothetical protein [Ktedonobacterales bacterium]
MREGEEIIADGAIEVEAQGKFVAVEDQHPLRALALPGQADPDAALLRGCERAIKEGHRPIELALPVKSGKGGSPHALHHTRYALYVSNW